MAAAISYLGESGYQWLAWRKPAYQQCGGWRISGIKLAWRRLIWRWRRRNRYRESGGGYSKHQAKAYQVSATAAKAK